MTFIVACVLNVRQFSTFKLTMDVFIVIFISFFIFVFILQRLVCIYKSKSPFSLPTNSHKYLLPFASAAKGVVQDYLI